MIHCLHETHFKFKDTKMVKVKKYANFTHERAGVTVFISNSFKTKEHYSRDFPGGPVVKNPPCDAGDEGSIPDWGTKIPDAAGQLSPCTTTTEPARLN